MVPKKMVPKEMMMMIPKKMVEFLLDCLLFGKKCAQFARSIKQYHTKVMQHVNISLSIKNDNEHTEQTLNTLMKTWNLEEQNR